MLDVSLSVFHYLLKKIFSSVKETHRNLANKKVSKNAVLTSFSRLAKVWGLIR